MTWRPDPTFYPSPRMAMKAPPEKLADVAPKSKSYSTIVGSVEMPTAGDELHHFGWNACSSCLCPNAPHPHVERRYLVVPGLRSSRIHILDTKPDPKNPKIVKVIEPDELADKAGYTPAYGALRTRWHLCCRPWQPRGQGTGRHFPDGSRDLRCARAVGDRSRGSISRLRRLVAPRPRHAGHQRMGHARHIRERADPGSAAWRQVWQAAAFLGFAETQASADHRLRRQVSTRVRTAAGSRPDQGLWLRQLRDQPGEPVVLDLDLVSRR